MGTQWARQEAKRNEIAAVLEGAVLWVRYHPQLALWGGIGLAAVVFLGVAFYNKVFREREESWSRFSQAQIAAYGQRTPEALRLVQQLEEEFPASPAASYGLLLAGDILYEQKKFTESAAAYQKILDQPNHPEILPLAMANLGLAQEAAGDCKSGSDTDERFLGTEKFESHFLVPQVRAALARCLAAMGQMDKAAASLNLIESHHPDTYWAAWAKTRHKT